MTHRCHAFGCAVSVPPRKLLCAKHWIMVPVELRMPVIQSYRRGQCDDKCPSRAWIASAARARAYIAQTEGYERMAAYYEQIALNCEKSRGQHGTQEERERQRT